MKVLKLAALAFGVFAVIATAIWYFAWRPARYVDARNGFSIRFTAEWDVWGEGEGATVRAVRTMGVSQGGGTGIISVYVSPIVNIKDGEAYRSWFAETIARKFKGFAKIKEGSRAIAGVQTPWLLYLHQTEPGDVRVQVWQFFLVRESRGYLLTCTAAPFQFEEFRRDFEEAVDSFKLE
jgi:hypothetical protein